MISVDRSSRQALLDAAKVEKGRDMSRDPVNGSHSANDTIFAKLFGRKVISRDARPGASANGLKGVHWGFPLPKRFWSRALTGTLCQVSSIHKAIFWTMAWS